MRKELLALALGLSLVVLGAGADVLTVPEGEPTPPIVLPAKGISMAEVEKKFGEPRTRHPTVGGGAPQQPPITRWDYDGFSVIFERSKVVDAVIPGAPPKIHRRDELVPVPVMMPAPSTSDDMPAGEPSPESQAPQDATGMSEPDETPAPEPEPEMFDEPAEPEATSGSPEPIDEVNPVH